MTNLCVCVEQVSINFNICFVAQRQLLTICFVLRPERQRLVITEETPYCCSQVFTGTLVAPDLLLAVSGAAVLSPDLVSRSSCNRVCVFGNCGLLRTQASINNGPAITIVICMHSFTWLHHLTGGSKQCSIQCKDLLEPLSPGFNVLFRRSIKVSVFSQGF